MTHTKQGIWFPFTPMKTVGEPIQISRAKGAILYTETGEEIIDCISSWWVNIHGHCHPHIVSAITHQASQLEQVIFAGFSHEPAIKLSERLLKILPGKPDRLFFSDDGSTSVEVALKMALQFHSNQGIKRKRILAFENAYHGDTFGAMAVSGRSVFNEPFEDLLFEVDFIPVPTGENFVELMSVLDDLLNKHEYAAFIFEPLVQGSAGMVMYDASLLEKILLKCKQSKLILIADEIFTGFGRTGKMFACDYLVSIQPDIVCVSKGLTGGFLPLGITACRNFIYDAFWSDDKKKTLFHGHSYTANPLACAAANASLDLFTPETDEKIQMINASHKKFQKRFHSKQSEVRVCGTILAIEFKSAEPTSYFNQNRDKIYNYFIKKGLLLRPLGNVIYVIPPYCITESQLQLIYQEVESLSVNEAIV